MLLFHWLVLALSPSAVVIINSTANKLHTRLVNRITDSSTLKMEAANTSNVDLGGLVVSVLATGPKVRGFDPDRGRWTFKGDKNPEHNFLRRGSKAVGPMS
jgi:hypothetical protein